MVKKRRPLFESDPAPSEAALRRLLAGAYSAYRTLVGREGVACEWRRHNAESPWVMKVSQGPRTLFWLQPMSGAVQVTVLLGRHATDAALAGRVSKRLHAAIRAAHPYAEGRPVVVVVKQTADLAGVEELLAVKLAPRSKRT